MTYLVTGCAGFIGFHTCLKLLERGDEVVGIDNLNDYYDPRLKEDRLKLLLGTKNFQFQELDIADRQAMADYFARERPQRVIHLAAQAGVRYSIDHPHAYADSNLVGFLNILEGCRHNEVQHLVYASSSSVYGANQKLPFSVDDNVDHPVSLYGATKKANELMAHAYSHLFNLPTTGLRFFTVYGPWGRPDMAYFLFTKAILEGRPIEVYNHGQMKRDFTYIDDVVEGVVRVLDRVPTRDGGPKTDDGAESGDPSPVPGHPSRSTAPYRLYNIGNHTPVDLFHFIEVIEQALGKKAVKNLLPMQPGDVPATFADVDALTRDVGFAPSTPIEVGVERFVAWCRDYYRL
ncbi:MAG: NAD-dependent epimerase [candidate division WOR-3 bacterium]|nr:NAD-dependent epimerase [candidate division WOR-3 bacterium]